MDARRLTLALLARRAGGATICPSEVARALATESGDPTAWRTAMPTVHRTIDRMVAEGEIGLSWKGRDLEARSGPYRIHRRVR